MVRVRSSILLPLLLLSACASEPQQDPANTQLQANATPAKQNILACTGLPVAGQKCGLSLPKI